MTVGVDPEDVARLTARWEKLDLPVPLRILDSPFREITRPILGYVRSIRRESPRDLVVVYIPEYVVGHWWEQLLHNQSALRLKGRLLFTPGVVVASVPWQLASSAGQTGLEGTAYVAKKLPRATEARHPRNMRPVARSWATGCAVAQGILGPCLPTLTL